MALTPAKKRANAKWIKENYRQVKLSMPIIEAESLENYCERFSLSKSGFIREAIKEKMLSNCYTIDPQKVIEQGATSTSGQTTYIEETEEEQCARIAEKVGFQSGDELRLSCLVVKKIDSLRAESRVKEAAALASLLNDTGISQRSFLRKADDNHFGGDVNEALDAILQMYKLGLRKKQHNSEGVVTQVEKA